MVLRKEASVWMCVHDQIALLASGLHVCYRISGVYCRLVCTVIVFKMLLSAGGTVPKRRLKTKRCRVNVASVCMYLHSDCLLWAYWWKRMQKKTPQSLPHQILAHHQNLQERVTVRSVWAKLWQEYIHGAVPQQAYTCHNTTSQQGATYNFTPEDA